MHPFAVLVASLIALVTSGVVGAQTEKPSLRAAMQGTVLASLLLVLGCVVLGLWQAWAPWDLELVEK